MAPLPMDLPKGCAFHPRCDKVSKACGVAPEATTPEPDHLVRCHHPLNDGLDRGTAAWTLPIVELDKVSKRFVKKLDVAERFARRLGANVEEHTVYAVDSVDMTIKPGEVVGLVGESGCGKSTLGRCVAGVHQPSDGTIRYLGKDVTTLRGEEALESRLKVQMIFQDPMSSLNPRLKVAEIISEAPLYHGLIDRGQVDDYVAQTMQRVRA